jgi:O-succinylhomoserine sulfhydrylase
VICAAGVFGATRQLFENTLSRFGLRISFVPVTDVSAWQAAVTPSTKMLFVESPTNPTIEIADLGALAAIARACGAYMVVDNCFCTPVLQRPFQFGADVVIHSATKYLDGQGRVLGGAILARQELIEQKILPVQRSAGAALSPFNAWVLLKGLETLKLRVEAQCDNALRLARWLEKHPAIARVIYPGLTSHPQHDLARRQQSGAGAILAVEVRGAKAEAFRVINSTRLLSITANVGDVKTTITHPATTTHARISSEARREAGIGDAMLRIAVGLESIDDLCADLERGLSQLAVDRRAA